jgi:transcription elongation factor Elf1
MVCSKCRIILPSRAEFDAHIASKHLLTSSRASPLPSPAVKPNSFSSSTAPAVRTPTPVKPKQAPKPPTPVFKCKKCHESFKTNSQLEGHKCWAECDKCAKTFTTKVKSEKHKVEEHTFRCNKCRHVLDSKENLGVHMDTEHSHFCDKCGTVFDNKVLLASHVTKEHSFKCPYCIKLLDSEEAVLVHEKAEHAKCEVCEDEFTWVEATHACYFTKNRMGPKSDRVVVQNVYFPTHTNYFI